MTETLEQDAARHLAHAIEQNRNAAADLVPAVLSGDIEAGERTNLLNRVWFDLGTEYDRLTHTVSYPYRMTR